jgi:hypothetical protein
LYRGGESANNQCRRYETARHAGSNGRSLNTHDPSWKGKPRFMRALTRAPTHTQRVQLEQSGSYRIVDRDHMLSPCTPLSTKPAGISTRPPLKMSHTKVCSHWLAPHISATIATHLNNSLNIGAHTAFVLRNHWTSCVRIKRTTS